MANPITSMNMSQARPIIPARHPLASGGVLEVHENPPPTLTMQTLVMQGTLDYGMSFALVSEGVPSLNPEAPSATVNITSDLWIASDQPITVYLGDDVTNQTVASWWDKWAKPRCIRGYAGAQLSVRLAVTGVVVVWGATKLTPSP